MGKWSVAVVKTGHERRVAERFIESGIEHFLPLIRKRRSITPMFPSYLFTEVSKGFRQILLTTGVLDFIRSFDRASECQLPAMLPQSQLDQIRLRCDPDGVELDERDLFRLGQRVCVEEGPFAGFHGSISKLSDQGRVEVLLSLMGRRVRVGLHEDAVTAA